MNTVQEAAKALHHDELISWARESFPGISSINTMKYHGGSVYGVCEVTVGEWQGVLLQLTMIDGRGRALPSRICNRCHMLSWILGRTYERGSEMTEFDKNALATTASCAQCTWLTEAYPEALRVHGRFSAWRFLVRRGTSAENVIERASVVDDLVAS
jgi:hypothetical protein